MRYRMLLCYYKVLLESQDSWRFVKGSVIVCGHSEYVLIYAGA